MLRENLFIHIPRTGGTSIHKSLGSLASHRPDHTLAKDARGEFPNSFYYTFMRNPYTRMISCYECQFPRTKKHHYHLPKESQDITLERYVEIIVDGYHDNYDSAGSPNLQHWRPQTDWIFDDDDCLIVDYIGHTETLEKDVNEIGRIIGAETITTPPPPKKGFAPKPSYMVPDKFDIFYVNRSDWRYPGKYRHYFNDDTRKKVEKYYEKDIDFLKVKF